MENIKRASEQNAEGIRQAQNATRELHSLGQSLKNILQKFNL
jgi:methyl-accepting chemotaxis protein